MWSKRARERGGGVIEKRREPTEREEKERGMDRVQRTLIKIYGLLNAVVSQHLLPTRVVNSKGKAPSRTI